jgi:acyl-CoA reductase-like NAD-dependent aldehyde dehydrogenase
VVSEPDTIEVRPRPCWIAGHAEPGEHAVTVRHPYDGTEIADVVVPGAAQVERAVDTAARTARVFATTSAADRAAACDRIADLINERSEEIAEMITAEKGRPLRWAEVEVVAAADAFRFAAQEARGPSGDSPCLDPDGRLTLARRRSRGPVLAVSTAEHPLYSTARQVAAAVAVGAPVVVVPAPPTPMTALLLGEILAEADLPAGVFSVLPVPDDVLAGLLADPRLPVVAGGPAAGKHEVPKVTTPDTVVVCPDADLDVAAWRIATSGAGLRVVVPTVVAEPFVARLADTARSLRTGDPHDPDVEIGPLIDEATAERTAAWISTAVRGGGELLAGGHRTGTCVAPTVLRAAPSFRDVPAPVVVVSVVDNVRDALDQARGPWTALFTRDVSFALDADVAGDLMVGDVSPDTGRAGVRATIRAYTHDRLLLLTNVTL